MQDKIVALLEKTSALSANAMATKLGLESGKNLTYHLTQLAKAGRIRKIQNDDKSITWMKIG